MRVACLVVPLLLFSRPVQGKDPVRLDATVDRIEEDRLVLDLPPWPSLPIPRALAPDLVEGAAVTIEVSVAADGEISVAVERDRLLLTLEGSRPFRWPPDLAPKVVPGERLRMRVSRDPSREAARAAEIARLKGSLLDP